MSKIDTALIEGYAEMSAEDKVKALEALELGAPSTETNNDGELDRLKRRVDELAHENKVMKDEKRAKMTEDEKAEAERAETMKALQDELAKLHREKDIASHHANYVALGYDDDLAKKTAEALVDGKIDKVFEYQKTFLDNHDKALKANAMKDMTTPPATEGKKQMTKADIMKIQDTVERQKAIEENIELFT